MRFRKIVAFLLLAGVLLILGELFLPRSYTVNSFKERPGTQYWQLETGSKIGYTKIKSKGAKSSNPIIYLHGGPGGKITDATITALQPLSEQGHDLYFYDQIGSGHSDRLDDIKEYSVQRHQKDLKEIVSKTGVEQVILLGHSWGACLAINFLQDNNHLVEKIILTGPGPILPINSALKNDKAPDSLSLIEPEFSNRQGNKKANNWRSILISKWARIFNTKLASDAEVDDFYTFLNQELSKSTACKLNTGNHKEYSGGGGYYSHLMTLRSLEEVPNKRTELNNINVPILILRGQCDNQKWGFVNEYLDIFPNAELEIIQGVGHDILSTRKDVYYDLVNDFLLKE